MLGGKPNRRFRMAWLLVGCGMLAGTGLLAPACSSDDSKHEAPQLGQMALDLTATDASGARYRLRNGVFEITAFSSDESFVVSTEDEPNAATIDVELAADVYWVSLRPGNLLEQVSTGGDGGAAGTGGTTGRGGAAGAEPENDAESRSNSGPEIKRLSDLLSFRSEHPERKLPSGSARTTAALATTQAELPHPVDTELVSDNPVVAQ